MNGLRASQRKPGGSPMVSQHSLGFSISSGVWGNCYFSLHLQHWPTSSDLLCLVLRRQSRILQSGTFWPWLFKTDQHCSAKAEYWAEHYAHPVSYQTYWADSPRGEGKAAKIKGIIFTQPGDREDMLTKFQKSQFWKTLQRCPSKRVESGFPHTFHVFLSFIWEIWVQLYLTILQPNPVQPAWMMGLSPRTTHTLYYGTDGLQQNHFNPCSFLFPLQDMFPE